MKKLLLLIAAIIVIVIGFTAFNSYIYNEKQGDGTEVTSYQGTLTGIHTCLPHADTDGPQTLECMFGMKTDTGEIYALDFSAYSQDVPMSITTGGRFSVTGRITPVEVLETDQWEKYAIEGVMVVTDIVEKL